MGARPSTFRRGGGFLNNVDGTITGYRFTDEEPSKDGPIPFKPGKIKDQSGKLVDKPHRVHMVLSAREDDARADVSTFLAVGKFDDFVISDDGLTLTSSEEGGEASLAQGTAGAKFVASLVEAGFPEDAFDEDNTRINFEPMIGSRVRFTKRVDAERTKKFGKVKGKDGREYDRDDLVVGQFYGKSEVAASPAPAVVKPKPNGGAARPSAATEAKAATKTVKGATDVRAQALLAIFKVLGDAGGEITKAKLGNRILQEYMDTAKYPWRDEVRTWALDDANLASLENEGIRYDQTTRVVALIT